MKRVCLISGAGGHLGQALCKRLCKDYYIIANYRKTIPEIISQIRRPIKLTLPAKDQNKNIEEIFCVQADLTQKTDIKRLVEVSIAKFGNIDAIINSAADLKFHGKLLDLYQTDDYSHLQLLTNSIAPMHLVSAVFDACWKNEPDENLYFNRNVINVSSMSGLNAYKNTGQAFYSASKAALNILTLHLSLELAPYNVRANAICPGRFSDFPSTEKVVDGVIGILQNSATGKILTNY